MCTCFIKGRSQPTNVSSALSLRVTVKDISFTHQHSRYSDSLYLQRFGILYFGIIRFAFGIFSYVPDFIQAKAYMGQKMCNKERQLFEIKQMHTTTGVSVQMIYNNG